MGALEFPGNWAEKLEVSMGGGFVHPGFAHHRSVTVTLNASGFPLQMDKNGIYKAMGEFDIFINYIEKYLTMRRRS